ncbi:hypothetical protein GCM10023259_031080 [Thermocatellispora tengchongensis]
MAAAQPADPTAADRERMAPPAHRESGGRAAGEWGQGSVRARGAEAGEAGLGTASSYGAVLRP